MEAAGRMSAPRFPRRRYRLKQRRHPPRVVYLSLYLLLTRTPYLHLYPYLYPYPYSYLYLYSYPSLHFS